MTQTSKDNWSCSEAIAWYARSIHNAATESYMTQPDEERFREIASTLQGALDDLRTFSVRDVSCPMGWCKGSGDRCVPCPEPEMERASKGA